MNKQFFNLLSGKEFYIGTCALLLHSACTALSSYFLAKTGINLSLNNKEEIIKYACLFLISLLISYLPMLIERKYFAMASIKVLKRYIKIFDKSLTGKIHLYTDQAEREDRKF